MKLFPLVRSMTVAVLVGVVALGIAPSAHAGFDTRPPTAKTCANIKARALKATGAARARLLRQHATCLKDYRAGRFAMAAFANGRYEGAREDGETFNERYCANNRWMTDIGSTIEQSGRGWHIVNVHVRGRNIELYVVIPEEGGQRKIAYRRVAGAWQVGIAFADDHGYGYGDVTRTDGTPDC